MHILSFGGLFGLTTHPEHSDALCGDVAAAVAPVIAISLVNVAVPATCAMCGAFGTALREQFWIGCVLCPRLPTSTLKLMSQGAPAPAPAAAAAKAGRLGTAKHGVKWKPMPSDVQTG